MRSSAWSAGRTRALAGESRRPHLGDGGGGGDGDGYWLPPVLGRPGAGGRLAAEPTEPGLPLMTPCAGRGSTAVRIRL